MSDSDQPDQAQPNDSSAANGAAPAPPAPSGFEGQADGFINSSLENVGSRIPGGDGFVKNVETEVDSRANTFMEEEEKNLPGGLGSMFGGGERT